MAVVIDVKVPSEQQEQVKKIIKELRLDNLKVTYDLKIKSLVFNQDRRVVTVPVELIESEKWADIRFLFRATLDSANSLWNMSSDTNDWSGKNYYNK